MYNTKWLFCISILILVVSISTSGCSGISNKQDADSEVLELRSYEVPPEYASEVNSIVNSLLGKMPVPGAEDARIGRASLGPGNLLLVTAPPSIHSGIETMLADLKDSGFEPPRMVALTYWIVVGRTAKDRSWPDNLSEISPALSAIADSEGSMEFSLQERLKILSLSGESAMLLGQAVSISQTVNVQGGRVMGDLSISYGRDRFNTTIQMELEKLLVLGQRGIEDPSPDINKRKNGNKTSASLFYIARASSQ